MNEHCVLYAKVGKAPLCDDLSLNDQLSLLQKFANHFHLVVDEIVTSTGEDEKHDRLSMKKLFYVVCKTNAKRVVVVSSAALSSEASEMAMIVKQLNSLGAKVLEMEPGRLTISSEQLIAREQLDMETIYT